MNCPFCGHACTICKSCDESTLCVAEDEDERVLKIIEEIMPDALRQIIRRAMRQYAARDGSDVNQAEAFTETSNLAVEAARAGEGKGIFILVAATRATIHSAETHDQYASGWIAAMDWIRKLIGTRRER